jgi:hypothetical protein
MRGAKAAFSPIRNYGHIADTSASGLVGKSARFGEQIASKKSGRRVKRAPWRNAR